MKYQDHKCTDLKIAYIGGGSHAWAWVFMTDLAQEEQISGAVRLYDIDEEAAKNNEIIGNRLFARGDVKGKWKFETKRSLKSALEDVDFVIISILPGTFDEMEVDVHLPETYGIFQSVGDTAGPGGLMRALRTIPIYRVIAEAVKENCPDAWVINYTNPMSLCVKTLYEIFPEIKAFGCCHEVFGTQKVLRDICRIEEGIEGIRRDEIIVNVQGINHFTWFTKASYQGIDLFPIYRKFISEHFEEGYHDPDRNWMNGTFNCAHRVKFDLFNKYGAIAAAGDRHLAEFMPGDMYLRDPETVEKWKFALTTVEWRKKRQAEKNAQALRLAAGEEEIELKETGEEGIRLIKALCGLERIVSNVNIPNTAGQLNNIPRTAVVETNAVFSRDSVAPVAAGDMPDGILQLTMPHVENHERILAAALNCDFGKAMEAFMEDPLVKGRISEVEGRELLKEMMRGTADYLPGEWF
ncbi:alpha-glucosidase/alpha-galactosidase [Clostridium sp. MCC353]|uniref:family 4 glycosyl hydrolase n=1 Tax=Clostridium sp. MCC353 TaxID=2592646 RepID=UPI001C02054D|nr:alpha-glucosidase/alpha-galactosidase [Clostridium sp. MCC353]MBT9778564.1 alpha-glucosidase/alpha-galactosidase [Clostridium sp. MCC353]